MPRPNWEYIRIDVRMPHHPKVDPLTYPARWTLIELWCHCGEELTDGFVRDRIWKRTGTASARQQLVDSGWADRVSGGYQMHDYLQYQRSRADVERLSARRRKAGALGALAKQLLQQEREQNLQQKAKQPGSKREAEAEADTPVVPSARGQASAARAAARNGRRGNNSPPPQPPPISEVCRYCGGTHQSTNAPNCETPKE